MAATLGNVLVIRGGAVGDFVLTLPVLRALRRSSDRLAVLGPPAMGPLAVADGLADEWKSLEAREWANWFVAKGACDSSTTSWLADFDIVISYLHDPDGVFERNLRNIKPLCYLSGEHKPLGKHMTKTLAAPLEKLDVMLRDEPFRLEVIPEELPWSGNWLAVHPGSGSERKNWAEENWRKLFARINEETDWDILLIGGEAEDGRIDRLAADLPSTRVAKADEWPLVRLAGALANCTLFAGVDSGIRHLAEAVGLSGVALWGQSNVREWGPRDERWEILHGLKTTSVDTMFMTLMKSISA